MGMLVLARSGAFQHENEPCFGMNDPKRGTEGGRGDPGNYDMNTTITMT